MQAHCLKNGLAQTVLVFLQCAQAKSSNSRDTTLAETTSVSSPQACHSLVLEQHQRVIGFLGSPVRLTTSQAQGSMSAFTPKTTTLDLVAQTKRDRQENRAHTSTQRSYPYIHVYATSLRRHRLKSEQPGTVERREERQHNSSSATTNTDGHPDQSFPLLPCQKCPTDCNHLVNKFVCKQGQTPKPLTHS